MEVKFQESDLIYSLDYHFFGLVDSIIPMPISSDRPQAYHVKLASKLWCDGPRGPYQVDMGPFMATVDEWDLIRINPDVRWA